MAVTISNAYLFSATLSITPPPPPPPPSSSSRTVIYNYHSYVHTRWTHRNYRRYTGLFTCKASSNADSTAEESRWLREEQRWLREEQRWLREEARWNAERQSLLLQIQHLKSELDRGGARSSSPNFDIDFVIDDDSSASQTLIKMAALLKGLVSESKSGGVTDDSKRITAVSEEPMELEFDAPASFDHPVAAPVSPPESESESEIDDEEKVQEKVKVKTKAISSLRMGAEGDEVRVLQEALMSLGFYSGEEDMEFSSFSDGTSRAVKTWQASIGIREDGIMTAELLERLYASQEVQSSESSLIADVRKIDEANGAVAQVREVQQAVVEKTPTDFDEFRPRVFLLGENRWEEPSRLNKTGGKTQVSGTRCLTCKGEGRLLCMECDGTGEPNVEEQFLDWVGDAAQCPYCEGLGYNVCDVCGGKPVL